jgi:hypothetical protein
MSMNIWSIKGLSPDLSSSLSPLTIFFSFATSSPILDPLNFLSYFLAGTTKVFTFSSSLEEEDDYDEFGVTFSSRSATLSSSASITESNVRGFRYDKRSSFSSILVIYTLMLKRSLLQGT